MGSSNSEPVGSSSQPHGLLIVAIELAALAGIAAAAKHVVQSRSGLPTPQIACRDSPHFIDTYFHPAERPLLFALALSLGFSDVATGLATILATWLSFFVGPVAGILVVLGNVLALGFSGLIAVLVYRANGGTNWKTCAAANTVLTWLMNLLGYNISHRWLALFALFFLFIFQVPFYLRGAYHRVPEELSAFTQTTTSETTPAKTDHTTLYISGLLSLVRLLTLSLPVPESIESSYTLLLSEQLSFFILLSLSALASVVSVKHAFVAGNFQWQWRAFFTPLVPIILVDLVLRIFTFEFNELSFFETFIAPLPGKVYSLAGYGGTGVLGAIIYTRALATTSQTSAQ